jgi:hypothetical protein
MSRRKAGSNEEGQAPNPTPARIGQHGSHLIREHEQGRLPSRSGTPNEVRTQGHRAHSSMGSRSVTREASDLDDAEAFEAENDPYADMEELPASLGFEFVERDGPWTIVRVPDGREKMFSNERFEQMVAAAREEELRNNEGEPELSASLITCMNSDVHLLLSSTTIQPTPSLSLSKGKSIDMCQSRNILVKRTTK